MKKTVCSRQPKTPGGFKFSCQYCGQGFSTIVGLQYVCISMILGMNNSLMLGSTRLIRFAVNMDSKPRTRERVITLLLSHLATAHQPMLFHP